MLGSIYLSTCCGVQGHSIVDFSFVAAFRATLRTNTKATSKIKKKTCSSKHRWDHFTNILYCKASF